MQDKPIVEAPAPPAAAAGADSRPERPSPQQLRHNPDAIRRTFETGEFPCTDTVDAPWTVIKSDDK